MPTTLDADPAAIVHLRGRQGDDLRLRLTFQGLSAADVAALTIRADVAPRPGLPTIASFTRTDDDTSVVLTLDKAVTATMPEDSYFDVLVEGPTIPANHPAAGRIKLRRSVTL